MLRSGFACGVTVADYDNDGFDDIFITYWGQNVLYHNNGDGTFTDVTEASGIGKATGSFGLTAVAADFDNDGWPDIYLACDSTPSLLFRNRHDGTFSEEGLERGVVRRGALQLGANHGRLRSPAEPETGTVSNLPFLRVLHPASSPSIRSAIEGIVKLPAGSREKIWGRAYGGPTQQELREVLDFARFAVDPE